MLEPVEERLHIRGLLLGALGLSLFVSVFSVVARKPSGFLFALLGLFATGLFVWRAFSWSPDPRARWKFLLLALAALVGGALGAVAIDTATVEILIRMGRCPQSVGCF